MLLTMFLYLNPTFNFNTQQLQITEIPRQARTSSKHKRASTVEVGLTIDWNLLWLPQAVSQQKQKAEKNIVVCAFAGLRTPVLSIWERSRGWRRRAALADIGVLQAQGSNLVSQLALSVDPLALSVDPGALVRSSKARACRAAKVSSYGLVRHFGTGRTGGIARLGGLVARAELGPVQSWCKEGNHHIMSREASLIVSNAFDEVQAQAEQLFIFSAGHVLNQPLASLALNCIMGIKSPTLEDLPRSNRMSGPQAPTHVCANQGKGSNGSSSGFPVKSKR